MRKNRIFSTLVAAALAAQILAGSAVAAEDILLIAPNPTASDSEAVTEEWTPPLSIAEELPEGNLFLGRSAMNDEKYLTDFKAANRGIEYIEDANGGYIRVSNAQYHYLGIEYINRGYAEPGFYKFTGYFRTAVEDEISNIRVNFCNDDGETLRTLHVNINNEWTKAEFYFEATELLGNITIIGGADSRYIQDFCIDHFSLVKVESIPEGMDGNTVGEPVDPQAALESMLKGEMYIEPYDAEKNARYEMNGGIMINGDGTFFQGIVFDAGCTITEQEIIDYARQFEGTHMTDYIINVNDQVAVYPSMFDTDYLEKYYTTEEKEIAVDYTQDPSAAATKHIFETLGTDYVGLWCETFNEIGINPWISFRMNDVHEQRTEDTSLFFSEFWYKNPQYYLVTHRRVRENWGRALNYTYKEVRDYYLGKINDALNRYNCYGIELDYQREIRLFHLGGSYKGLEILNEFMREVDDLVAVYEEKYGHEIKIGVRVASDPVTCYDFGLDVVTWAAEGIIDMVCPTGRFTTTDFDMPIKLWKSILSPYGVELAAGIEQNIASYPDHSAFFGEKRHTLETMAACAANAYSQGADKIYFYNYFYGLTPVEHMSTNTTLYSVTSPQGYWNVLTSFGSYDKIMTFNRRHILTYNDTNQLWKSDNSQLPKEINRNQLGTFSIAIGDVPEDADVILKFTSSEWNGLHAETPPTVYINSKEAEFIGIETTDAMSDYKMLCYKVPDEVKNDGRIVFEVTSTVKFTVDYVEVDVKAVH